MFRLISCIGIDHSWPQLTIAIAICVIGSLLSVRLLSRAGKTVRGQKAYWIFLSGFVGGATIWATHFMTMLGYKSGLPSGYDPDATLLSMLLAVGVMIAGFAISTVTPRATLIEAGGLVAGLGVALMHYVGLAGYEIAAQRQYDVTYVVASIICAALFGAMVTNRVLRPTSRYTKYIGAVALMAAIASTHFLGMTALTLYPDPTVTVLPGMLSVEAMTIIVAVIMLIILALGASTYIIDFQSTRESAERYRLLSLQDPLTHLPNRTALQEHIQEIAKAGPPRKNNAAVLSIDLDRFKEVNDVHGHAAGDAVLKTIAQRLKSIASDDTFIARVGGDEFIAVMTDFFRRAEVAGFAAKIIERVREPVAWNDQLLAIGSSVGISASKGHTGNWDELITQADIAMYRAKSTGSNLACFYESTMDQASKERNLLSAAMRQGIANGEFELFYQKQNDTRTREVVAFEVLLRWKHPVKGYISPMIFIPIAEKTGFIVELGEWVLRTACAEAARWDNPLRIAVNVAPRQLGDNRLPQLVHETLLHTGLPASRLEIEITETGLIADHQNALHTIRRLKAIGVKVAMDDYGTGYSSLSTLQSFPFDKIKIDRTFVAEVTSNKLSAAIVRSTLILASSLDIPVLAEGVESEENLEFLWQEGCEQVQGFLFGQPAPRSEIEAVVNPSRRIIGAGGKREASNLRSRFGPNAA